MPEGQPNYDAVYLGLEDAKGRALPKTVPADPDAVRREREVQHAQREVDATARNAVPYAPPLVPRRPMDERVHGVVEQYVKEQLPGLLRGLRPSEVITIKRNVAGDGRAPFTLTVRTHE